MAREPPSVVFHYKQGLLVTVSTLGGACAGVIEIVCRVTESRALYYAGFQRYQVWLCLFKMMEAVCSDYSFVHACLVSDVML